MPTYKAPGRRVVPPYRYKVEEIDATFYTVTKLRRVRRRDDLHKVVPAEDASEILRMIENGKFYLASNGLSNALLTGTVKIHPDDTGELDEDGAEAMGLELVADEQVPKGTVWIGYETEGLN